MAKPQTLAFLLPLALVACGGPYPEPSTPSMMESSTYSTSSSSFSGTSSPSLPQRDAGRGELLVKPDLVCVPFVLRAEVIDAKAGLALLEEASKSIRIRFEGATGGASTTKMLGGHVVAISRSKLSSGDNKPRFVVTVDGSIETPFAADSNYWGRTNLVASLVVASTVKEPLVAVAGEGQPEIESAFGGPEIKLRDPDSFRAELLKKWVERARAFAHAAESQAAPLEIVGCEPPTQVVVNPISVEQVALSLAVQCRIDITRKGAL
jgi:hypothetical protein